MNTCVVLALIPDAGFYLFFGGIAAVAAVLLFCRKLLAGGIVGGFGVLFLAAVVLPDIRSAKPEAYRMACIANLKAIQDEKARWAGEHKKIADDAPAHSDLFGEGCYLRRKPECPAGGSYAIGAVGQKFLCSEIRRGHKLE